MILSPRQAQVLALIDREVSQGKPPPTVKEIAEELGVYQGAITDAQSGFITRLVHKGFLHREEGTARGLTILKKRDQERVLIAGVWYEYVPADRL